GVLRIARAPDRRARAHARSGGPKPPRPPPRPARLRRHLQHLPPRLRPAHAQEVGVARGRLRDAPAREGPRGPLRPGAARGSDPLPRSARPLTAAAPTRRAPDSSALPFFASSRFAPLTHFASQSI